ncbi:MAG TPA: hypothetical protein VFD03_07080 [Clostridia bacterium]|nr:hypothetical protein [Clostridia bacterium]
MSAFSIDQLLQTLTIDQALQIFSILASGAFVGLQIKSSKKLEIDSKIHQQRKEQYKSLIDLLKKIFIMAKNPTNIDVDMAFTQDEWFNVNLGMSLYASGSVFKAYSDMKKTSIENPKMAIRKLGDLIVIMRKEVGLDDSTLTSRQILSAFINDIDSPEHDYMFK